MQRHFACYSYLLEDLRYLQKEVRFVLSRTRDGIIHVCDAVVG